MKKLSILLIAIVIVSCHQTKKEVLNNEVLVSTSEEKSFDWLLGDWERLHEKEGKRTFEFWKKINTNEYAGIGFTMKDKDTIWQETMRLVDTDGNWNLLVKAPEDSKPTLFKMTNHNDNEFTCENKEIEFPNKIKYWKNGNKMNALVSNAEMEIPFEFEKLKIKK